MRTAALLPFIFVTLVGCAAPLKHYSAPPTAPVHTKIAETKSHIANASTDAKAAQEAIANARGLAVGNASLLLQLEVASSRIDSLTQSLLLATASADDAEMKLQASDKNGQDLADAANKLGAENVSLKAFEKRMNGTWGLGAVGYGIGRLFKHILIALLILVLVSVALAVASFFFPALGPVMGFFLSIWRWFLSFFSKKPQP